MEYDSRYHGYSQVISGWYSKPSLNCTFCSICLAAPPKQSTYFCRDICPLSVETNNENLNIFMSTRKKSADRSTSAFFLPVSFFLFTLLSRSSSFLILSSLSFFPRPTPPPHLLFLLLLLLQNYLSFFIKQSLRQ